MFSSVGRASVSYGPLSDMNLSKGSTQNIETSIYPVTFRVYSYATVDNRTETRLRGIIHNSTRLLSSYARERGLPLEDCAGNQVIEFFIIPYSVLNDRSRFSEWPYENGPGSSSSNIVALFSPRRGERNIDAMLFTNDSFNRDHYVAHEIAHYWYERLCWSSKTTTRTEPLAMDFESYYLSNRSNITHTANDGAGSIHNSNSPVINGGHHEDRDYESYYSDIPVIRGSGSSFDDRAYEDEIPVIRGASSIRSEK